jgi:hypothetical protein
MPLREDLSERIRLCRTPREAFDLTRTSEFYSNQRSDWDLVKDSIMFNLLIEKFTQHKNLALLLKNTGNKKIIEHTKNDNYWGDGGNSSGQNKLGELLMIIRDNYI